jgi:nucleoside-diphosphate-sugar epimerase
MVESSLQQTPLIEKSSSESKEVILVTGITGFVGAWVGKLLLEQLSDRFKIRASVRSLANKKKMEPLRLEYGDQAY